MNYSTNVSIGKMIRQTIWGLNKNVRIYIMIYTYDRREISL